MNKFERYLASIGYLCYTIRKGADNKLRYVRPKRHLFSSMGDLCYFYFPKDDPIIKKIEQQQIIGEQITRDDRKKEICYGLHEAYKPPTLISPRPKIQHWVLDEEQDVWYAKRENLDDVMNVCLMNEEPETIYKALYDESITFTY